MKIFSAGPNLAKVGLVGLAAGWDGPWTGTNFLTDDYPMVSKDLNELNRDPRLTFIGWVLLQVTSLRHFATQCDTHRKDIKGHGYTEKAVKQCGMRYMGPMFYENWLDANELDADGNCISTDIVYAQVLVRNSHFWSEILTSG